ncbi:GFA family protein [uncultured Maritalea sp.]|uniref:GFA family protein n=1 Tax=uncultured Maritalea sp. TaxID=757249 RepID=UPI0026017888|nr:GFA family protein [uncultured Maritalea sp.]
MSDFVETFCACGAISVKILGEPRTTMLCACKDCQKTSGTGHSALALFSDDTTQISGETKSFSVTADSGATVQRNFCPNCGTPVFGVTSRVPGHKLLPVSMLGDAAETYKPRSLIFSRSHLSWDHIDPELPQFHKYKES